MRAELLIIRPRFLLGVASAILFTAVSLFLSLSLSAWRASFVRDRANVLRESSSCNWHRRLIV